MACRNTTPLIHTFYLTDAHAQVFRILKELEAEHMRYYTLQEYTNIRLEDPQYLDYTSIKDRVNLDRLWRICEQFSDIRDKMIGEILDRRE